MFRTRTRCPRLHYTKISHFAGENKISYCILYIAVNLGDFTISNITEGIIYEVKKAICGKDHIIAQALTAILAGGHILMEDVPGVGKTTMAVAFRRAFERRKGFSVERS